MNPTKGYYSLIQYCPDRGRLEAANIGVLLFCPEHRFLKALTSHHNRRIIRFFGSTGHDWARINSFKHGIEERVAIEGPCIKSLPELEHFIALRANLLQITPPRPMKVTEPEKDLQDLYQEFMGESHQRSSTKTFRQYLAERFEATGLERKIRHNIKVKVPVYNQKEVDFPFGFQNGRLNLINPVRFESADNEQVTKTACKYAVEGRSLYEHPDPQLGQLQLIVVGRFRHRDHESQSTINRIFQESHVKLYKATELPSLIDEIRRTGKDKELATN